MLKTSFRENMPVVNETVRTACPEDLVKTYYAPVYRLCLSILADVDEAEDATQECFILACAGLPSFRGESNLKTWLFAIAVNACRGMLRKRQRGRVLTSALGALIRLVGSGNSVEESAVRSDQHSALWAAVDRLDEKHRLPVILRYTQNLSVPEIARVLNVNEGTVHSRLHYAREYLSDWLCAQDPDFAPGREEKS